LTTDPANCSSFRVLLLLIVLVLVAGLLVVGNWIDHPVLKPISDAVVSYPGR